MSDRHRKRTLRETNQPNRPQGARKVRDRNLDEENLEAGMTDALLTPPADTREKARKTLRTHTTDERERGLDIGQDLREIPSTPDDLER
jgi:hypothetical protein